MSGAGGGHAPFLQGGDHGGPLGVAAHQDRGAPGGEGALVDPAADLLGDHRGMLLRGDHPAVMLRRLPHLEHPAVRCLLPLCGDREPHPLQALAGRGEHGGEHSVGEVDQQLLGAPGVGEVLDIAGPEHGAAALERGDDVAHQAGVGVTEAVDRLLRVSHPDLLVDELGEFEEEGELDGGGVLELVDREQPEAGGDRFPHPRRVLQQAQRLHLLVDEVDQAQLALVGLVGLERLRGDVEDERDEVLQVLLPGGVLCEALADLERERLEGFLRRRPEGSTGQPQPARPRRPFTVPQGPLQPPQRLEIASCLVHAARRDRPALHRLPGLVHGGREILREPLDPRTQLMQPADAQILPGLGQLRRGAELLPGGGRRGPQVLGRQEVGACGVGHVLHAGAPGLLPADEAGVPLVAVVLGAGEHRAPAQPGRSGGAVDRRGESRLLRRVVEHPHLWGDPRVERVLGHQAPGDGVDGADQGAVDAARRLDLLTVQQCRAHPLGELVGGFDGEGGGDDLGGVQPCGQTLGEQPGQGVCLAGAGRGVDQGEAHDASPLRPHSREKSQKSQRASTTIPPSARATSCAAA